MKGAGFCLLYQGFYYIEVYYIESRVYYYESFPVIGDFCPKPFGQFIYWTIFTFFTHCEILINIPKII